VDFTGERVIPGAVDPDLLNEHLARYHFACRFSSGKVVLDAACGSGYGSAMLAENAKAVYGADISPEAVEYARRVYGAPHVFFTQSDCLALPFPAAQFDLVVAFEIIEHLEDQEAFLQEMDRVLSPSGILLLSTPNRLYYTEERGETNPFHHHEFSFEEFENALQPLFAHRAILFENHVPGVLLAGSGSSSALRSPSSVVTESKGASSHGETNNGEGPENTAHYFVAVCSHRPLDPVSPLLYLPSTGNVLREREAHIRQLSGYLAEAKADADRARAEMARVGDEWKEMRARLDEVHNMLEELNGQVEERSRWAQNLDRELTERNETIRQLQDEHESDVQWALSLQDDLAQTRGAFETLQREFDERTRWAQNLDRELAERNESIRQLQEEHDSKVKWALSLQDELTQARGALEILQREFDERTAWALTLNTELNERLADLRTLYSSRWYQIGKKLRLSPVPPSDQS